MSAFTDFVQLELPKRPYLDSDVSGESVIVRRGAGPRQLDAITLTEGQVLGMSGGTLQGVAGAPAAAAEGTRFSQASASTTWTITHNKGNRKALVQVFDASNDLIIPDNINYGLNAITISLGIALAGTANVVFF